MRYEEKPACPSCGATNPRYVGPIPPSNAFAGRILDRTLPGGGLWRCPDCFLAFRHPRPAKHLLDELYRDGHMDNWPDSPEKRADWTLAAKFLAELPDVKRVLDVGCFDGRFLTALPSHYEKLGIEIHPGAAHRAESRGIRLIARDIEELDKHPCAADAVLAMDVIEHTEEPLRFLAQLVHAATPGGVVIIATGNTAAPSWRFMGSRYWYCHIAEHISFINPAWARRAAKRLKLEIVFMQKFSHGGSRAGWARHWRASFLNLAYRVVPGLFSKVRRLGGGGIDVRRHPELLQAPPYWLTAKDHFLVAFRKVQETVE